MLLIISIFTYAMLFIPGEYRDLIYSSDVMKSLGLYDSMQRWQSSFEMLRDNLFLGVGIGGDSFTQEIINYSPDFGYHNSGNFLLEIACEAGVISLVAFILVYLIRVRHRGIYQPYVRSSHVRKISAYALMKE